MEEGLTERCTVRAAAARYQRKSTFLWAEGVREPEGGPIPTSNPACSAGCEATLAVGGNELRACRLTLPDLVRPERAAQAPRE